MRGQRQRGRRVSLEVLEDRNLLAVNPIIAENQLPGSPKSEWDVVGAGDSNIEGFATDISVDQGQTVQFKINTDATNYRLDIYRMGYYGGMGARKVDTVQVALGSPQAQPAPLFDPGTGLIDAGNWDVSATWAVPANATSGIYFAKLVRQDGTPGASHVVFVVRDDDGGSDLLFQTSDATAQGYNNWGGKSTYDVTSGGQRAYKVSYNRPFSLRGIPGGMGETNWIFWGEYPMVRWLESNGYDVSYTTNIDTARRGAELLEHKAFLSVGHDEYWSSEMMTAAETARAAGVSLAFLTGNEIYWKVRWEDSIDGSGTPFRTMVTYKESLIGVETLPPYPAPIQVAPNGGIPDPSDVWTGLWRDTRFSAPGDAKVEQLLTGQIFSVNRGAAGTFGTSIKVPEAEGKLRFWRNTSVATLAPGEVATLNPGVIGYEWDEDVDNGYRPAGLIRLSETTEDVPEKLVDPLSWPGCGGIAGTPCATCRGCMVAPGQATHRLTMYKDPSGAIVFGAGTVQYSWGLDGNHDGLPTVPDVRLQQATVNLFADMGVQAGTLQPGLVQTTASTDAAKPTSAVTSQIAGLVFQTGATITVQGTAADVGGLVAGVEVSFDGGNRWHPAAGRGSWSFTWTPTGAGTFTVLTRAVDDSLNLGDAVAGPTFTVTPDETTPPQTSGVGATLIDNQTVTVAWSTDEASASRVRYGTSPGSLSQSSNDPALVFGHAVTLTGLTPNTTYYYRVESTDEFGNTSAWPAAGSPPLTFSTPAFVDTTNADFATGQGNGVYVSESENGELTLTPAVGVEFSGGMLPAGWSSSPFAAGGAAVVGGGGLTLDGASASSAAAYGPGRTLEFVATFGGAPFQNVGFSSVTDSRWALFSTGSDGAGLYVRTNTGSGTTDTLIPGAWTGAAHRYRIDWNVSTVNFWINGTLVASHAFAAGGAMSLSASDFNVGGGGLRVDWMRLSPYGAAGSYTSRVFDAGGEVTWRDLSWLADAPAGTGVAVWARLGDTATPDASWTDFFPIASPFTPVGGRSRYLQYRLDLTTADPRVAPSVRNVTLAYTTAADTFAPSLVGRSPAAGDADVPPGAPVVVRLNDLLDPASFAPSTFRLRRVGAAEDVPAAVSVLGSTATLTPATALAPDTQYQVTLAGAVKDRSGNPLGGDVVWTFTTGWLAFRDAAATDFDSGSPSGTAVVQSGDGELALALTAGSEFGGATLPVGWTSTAWSAGGGTAVGAGRATIDGAMLATEASFGPGRSLEFAATFGGDPYQHAGLAADLSGPLWAMFSTGPGGALFARTAGSSQQQTLVPGDWFNTPHLYRIDWSASAVRYFIDGAEVASHPVVIGSALRPFASDFGVGGSPLQLDWVRLSPYAPSGTFTSRVFDAGGPVYWGQALWASQTPAGTAVAVSVRMGNAASTDSSWTDWVPLPSAGSVVGGTSRYLQYRVELTTADQSLTPALQEVSFRYTAALPDAAAPRVVGRTPGPGAADVDPAAPVTVKFSELMDPASLQAPGAVRLRQVGTSVDVPVTVTYSGSTATLTPATPLLANRQYVVTVYGGAAGAKDASGNLLPGDTAWTFTTQWLAFRDTTASDFAGGALFAATYLVRTGDGEVALSPAASGEFDGAEIPSGWVTSPWAAGGATGVAGGLATVDGAFLRTPGTFTPGRSLEFAATFGGDPYQHAGLAADLSGPLWAMFSTGPGGALFARTAGPTGEDTLLPGNWLGAQHRFRIDWDAESVTYSIDGSVVATHGVAISSSLRPFASDFGVGSSALAVDWMRLGPYASSGSFVSRVFDAGQAVTFDSVLWSAQTPAGTAVAVSVRMGDSLTPDSSWTDWVQLAAPGATAGGRSRYIQYRADLSTSDPAVTPTLGEVIVRYTTDPDAAAPQLVGRTPAPGATGIDPLAPVKVTFSELMDGATISGAAVRLRKVGDPTDVPATITYASSTATLTPSIVLASNAEYRLTVAGTVTDPAGNALGEDVTWTFTTGVALWQQSYPGGAGLTPSFADDFSGTSLGSGWSASATGGGASSASVSGSALMVLATEVTSLQGFAGVPVEARIQFGAAPYQHFGLATSLSSLSGNYWALFSTAGTSDRLFARVNAGGSTQDIDVGALPGGFHDYRIKPVSGSFEFYVDGTLRATIGANLPSGTELKVVLSDYNGASASPLLVDWVRVLDYSSGGTLTSAIFDATRAATWGAVGWNAVLPAGTSIVVETRSGDTATPDGDWSDWAAVTNGGTSSSPSGRYFQFRVRFVTTDPTLTPLLFDISVIWA